MLECDGLIVIVARLKFLFGEVSPVGMGRVMKEALQSLPKKQPMNASAASPSKRLERSVDDLLSSTPRCKQSLQKFNTNLDMLAQVFCDDATAYGSDFGEGQLLSLQLGDICQA